MNKYLEMRNNMWTYKKVKNKSFNGNYELRKNGETWFYLEHYSSKGKKEIFKFRSWQKAKANGWVHG